MAQWSETWAIPMLNEDEGGFSNNPNDPGGITNHGVTKRSWEKFVGREVSEEEMQALTVQDVLPFYEQTYWLPLKLSEQPDQLLAESVFNFAINVRPSTLKKVIDGAIPLTQGTLFREKVRHYIEETDEHPTQKEFFRGWVKRAFRYT